jgi:hypothetical protein
MLEVLAMHYEDDLHSLRLEAARAALDYLSRVNVNAPEYRAGMDFINLLLRDGAGASLPSAPRRTSVPHLPIDHVVRIPAPPKTKMY